MPDREIVYSHTVKALTVGDLRKALEGVPDDTPLEVSTLEDPSSSPRKPVLAGPSQVITHVGLDEVGTVVLECDLPSGDDYTYYEKGW